MSSIGVRILGRGGWWPALWLVGACSFGVSPDPTTSIGGGPGGSPDTGADTGDGSTRGEGVGSEDSSGGTTFTLTL